MKSSLYYKFFRGVFRVVFGGMYFNTKVINKKNAITDSKAVVICNHLTALDPVVPIIKIFNKNLHFLSKVENFSTRFISRFLTKFGVIPVKRGEADINSYREVIKVLKSNQPILMYPEGTRNRENSHEFLPFKNGAASYALKTKSPIVPMVYYNHPKPFKKNYLYVGESFELTDFYDKKGKENLKNATELVHTKMVETQNLLNKYVEEHK